MPRRPKQGESLGDLRPALVDEWDLDENYGLTPFDVSVSSAFDAAWRCSACLHRWRAPVYSRARGIGCIKCRNRAIALRMSTPKPGQSLGDLYPHIARDWLPELNGGVTAFDVTPSPRIEIVWRCHECTHEWSTQASNRTKNDGHGTGCPDCWARNHSAHMARVKHRKDSIAGRAPDVAAEWDYDSPLNEGATPETVVGRSRQSRGWKCAEGHTWSNSPDNRVGQGQGCRDCMKGRESVQEVGLREFLAVRMPVVKGRVPRTDVGGKRPWLVDVLSVAAGVVVEFDGSWWHSERANPGMGVKDAGKAADIRSQGFVVVRVREAPLTVLHEHDLAVPLGLSGAEIGERVWEHLLGLGVGERLLDVS